MKSSVKVGMITVLAILLLLYLSVAFAGNENVKATKSVNMTNATENMTNTTRNPEMPRNISNETKNVTNVTVNFTNITMKPTNTTNSTMSVNNATNEGKKIEYDVRQQVEDIQVDAHNTTNITKDYANEIKSYLKDSSN